MQGVILAAGAGSRLAPVTLHRTKAMVPVCGQPLVGRVADSLIAAGVSELVVVVREASDDVAQYLLSRPGPPVKLAFQAERRGMAHALLCAAEQIRGPFLMTACDSLVDDEFVARLVAAHEAGGRAATLALERLSDPSRISKTGIVALTGDEVTDIVEKPKPEDAPSDIASMPLYAFSQRIIEYLPDVKLSPRGELELQDAIHLLIDRGDGVGGVMAERRWQVTTTADLLAMNAAFLDLGWTTPTVNGGRPPVHIEAGAGVGPGAEVGPYTVLEAGSQVGAAAVVRRSLVLAGGVVPPGAVVEDTVVAPD